jgi:arginyl-tRNA synthetase
MNIRVFMASALALAAIASSANALTITAKDNVAYTVKVMPKGAKEIDLALKASDENPVFYVQYAHARICSVLTAYAEKQADKDPGGRDFADADLSLLTAPTEAALMLKLADYPGMLTRAAADLAPHDVAFYLRELAAAFHTYYAAERFLVDDAALARARMALLSATAQVLKNALALLGVSAPEAMSREVAPVAPGAEVAA